MAGHDRMCAFFQLIVAFIQWAHWISFNSRLISHTAPIGFLWTSDYFHAICEISGCATVWCTSFQFNFDTFSSLLPTTFCAINTLEIFDNIFSSNRTYVQNQMSFNFNFNIDYSSTIFARVWCTFFNLTLTPPFPPRLPAFER